MTTRYLSAAAACLLGAITAHAAPSSSVLELFNRLPDPPTTAEARMLPLMVARDTQALKVRREAVLRELQHVAPTIAQADKTLKAAAYGEKALSSTNQSRIVGYDEGMLGEINLLVSKTEEIAKLASRNVHCGAQAVTVPQAVCR